MAFRVTKRNVSNWKTRGGYKEWRAAQEHALELRTFQDNLTGFLRRHDASELPEVGLQSAATTLSALLLRPDLTRELLSDPEKYSKLIELQCRLAREIQALQKNRDDTAKALGSKFNPERLKRQLSRRMSRASARHIALTSAKAPTTPISPIATSSPTNSIPPRLRGSRRASTRSNCSSPSPARPAHRPNPLAPKHPQLGLAAEDLHNLQLDHNDQLHAVCQSAIP